MSTEKQTHSCQSKRRKRGVVFSVVLIALLLFCALLGYRWAFGSVLRISNWETGEIYVETPAKAGDRLFFGWVHSLEKIPWNEYYYITAQNTLMLDSINFPAFGAGIPENKGRCRIEDGLIYMEDIAEEFSEFVFINSHFAVRDIRLNDVLIASGAQLPEHARLRLIIERRLFSGKQKSQ